MASRPGLVGEADGSTLFLDELGELPEALQAHILRVLDRDGDYQRLGESFNRKADLRVVAATNRRLEELRHDLAPRFTLRMSIPGLNDRREDIPLILRYLLQQTSVRDPGFAKKFDIPLDDPLPRLEADLVAALLRHQYRHHVRELETLLWEAITTSDGTTIGLSRAAKAKLELERSQPKRVATKVTPAMITDSLARHDGVLERVWRDLGLRNRFALRRLMLKHGIERPESA